MINWKTPGITIMFGLLLCGLLALHIRDPWTFSNDDNGAWFSAIARTHQQAGLVATRGQDFFISRHTGELIPYLHHPPLPGLILAIAFAVTGSDSPFTARLTFALLHVLTFAVIAGLARQLWNPGRKLTLYCCVLAVTATVPMSTFYGKMPNHEVPGLLFFILGVAAWGFSDETTSVQRAALALAAWFLAVFASWHAAFCIVAWLLVRWDRKRPLRTTLSIMAVLLMVGLAGLHLLWANHGQRIPSQDQSLRHWMLGGDGASLATTFGCWRHAVGIGMGRYAYLPAILAIGWLALLVANQVRTRQALSVQERGLIGLSLGSAAYTLLFPRAVSNHAYQGFYLIPFVALASSLAIQRLCQRTGKDSRCLSERASCLGMLTFTCILGIVLTLNMYRRPSPGAIKAAAAIESQYR
jgi:hypothetical protein